MEPNRAMRVLLRFDEFSQPLFIKDLNSSPCCLKCQAAEIIRVPVDQAGALPTRMGVGVFRWAGATRLVCVICGFTEEWVFSPRDLKKLKTKYPIMKYRQ